MACFQMMCDYYIVGTKNQRWPGCGWTKKQGAHGERCEKNKSRGGG